MEFFPRNPNWSSLTHASSWELQSIDLVSGMGDAMVDLVR